jgi:hypothetical protein
MVSFNKSGVIFFNKQACEQMDLSPGVKVILAQDDDQPENWYFIKDDKGFELTQPSKNLNQQGASIYQMKLIKELLAAFSLPEDESYKFKIAKEPTIIAGDETKYWPLLIK